MLRDTKYADSKGFSLFYRELGLEFINLCSKNFSLKVSNSKTYKQLEI